jgi:hypothetical protein
MLHELAQPMSALQCSLDVVLERPREVETYIQALHGAQDIANRMKERMHYFRDLSQAIEPCDCMQPVNAQPLLAAAIEEVWELAESMGTKIWGECEPIRLFGNEPKLLFGLLHLLDWLLANQQNTTLQLFVEDRAIGSVRLEVKPGSGDAGGANRESMMLATTALATIGAELFTEKHGVDLFAVIRLSSYRQPQSTTTVLMGNF